MPLSRFRTVTATVRFSASPPARRAEHAQRHRIERVVRRVVAEHVAGLHDEVLLVAGDGDGFSVRVTTRRTSRTRWYPPRRRAGFRRARKGLPRTCAPPSVTLMTYGSGMPSES